MDLYGPSRTDGSAYVVGRTFAGEWLEYTIDIAEAGTYRLDARVANAAAGGQFRLLVDGVDASGLVDVPGTGSWTNYQVIDKGGVQLAAGRHVLRIHFERPSAGGGAVGNLDWFRLVKDGTTPPPQGGQQPFGTVPLPVGGRIEAENFDRGGAGVAYQDADPFNAGGFYRTNEHVDVYGPARTDGDAIVVGRTVPGEWVEYTVDIASTGTLALAIRTANPAAGGRISLWVDGQLVAGNIAVPQTASWNAYSILDRSGVTLPAGRHVLRLSFDQAASNGAVGNVDWIELRREGSTLPPPTGGQQPWGAQAFRTGQTVQAEDFDRGGQGVAYSDADAVNGGGYYRPNEAVDIYDVRRDVGAVVVGRTVPGEWLEYTLDVDAAGPHTFSARVANLYAGGSFSVWVDGVNVSGPIAVPGVNIAGPTPSWNNYETVVRGGIPLTAGRHVVRLSFDQGGTINGPSSTGPVGNYDWWRFDPAS